MALRRLRWLATVVLFGWAHLGHAQEGETAAQDSAPEDWNARFQSTYVLQRNPAFHAPYTGPMSLSPQGGNTYTFTLTGAFGKRLWEGAEFYFDPEFTKGVALSSLTGMGGFYNGEITRASGPALIHYTVRSFLRQTWSLGGGQESQASAMNQLAGMVDKNRVVATIGFLPPLDIFDGNAYAHDPRTQFMSWCNMTHCAFDYAADARGNSWGVALEYYRGDWVLRVGQFMQPRLANQLPLDWQYARHNGRNLELEHAHELAGQPGKIRLSGWRNTALMGSYADAMASPGFAASNVAAVPATGTVPKEAVKYGFGYNLEQAIAPGIGLFSRAMWQDGRYETYAFTEAHRSVTVGASIQGALWGRERDTLGIAAMRNALSGVYRQYLAAGGLGYFIGDGKINYRDEQILETYYSLGLMKNFWATVDYQSMHNPAYNADRGPVSFIGMRLHWEQ